MFLVAMRWPIMSWTSFCISRDPHAKVHANSKSDIEVASSKPEAKCMSIQAELALSLGCYVASRKSKMYCEGHLANMIGRSFKQQDQRAPSEADRYRQLICSFLLSRQAPLYVCARLVRCNACWH